MLRHKWQFDCAYTSKRVWHNPSFVLFFLEAIPLNAKSQVTNSTLENQNIKTMNRENLYSIVYKQKIAYLTQPLVGFTVTKKFGKAVERNKIKRRFRVLVRKYLSNIKIGFFVLLAKTQAKNTSFEKLHNDFVFALKKMKLLVS